MSIALEVVTSKGLTYEQKVAALALGLAAAMTLSYRQYISGSYYLFRD